jgi:hypothetical protein
MESTRSVKDIRVNGENQTQILERIQKGSELTGEEVRLLHANLERRGSQDRLPVGTTVGELIAEQRGFESQASPTPEALQAEVSSEAEALAPSEVTPEAAPEPEPRRTARRDPPSPPPATQAPRTDEQPSSAPPAQPPAPAPEEPQQVTPAPAPEAEPVVPAEDAPPQWTDRPPAAVVVPKGTQLAIRLEETVSSKTHRAGDTFEASLSNDLVVDGWLVAPRGSKVTGLVPAASPSGKVKGLARLTVALQELWVGEDRYPLRTAGLSFEAEPTKKEDAKKVGIAAGAGALIGAIAGGKKGAAIGGAAGAAAGAGAVLVTSGKEVEFAVEHPFTFELTATVEMKLIGPGAR